MKAVFQFIFNLLWFFGTTGNVISVTDPLGRTTRTDFDGANRPYQVTNALGHVTRTVYDENGNVIRVTDDNGNSTLNIYDPLNRLVTTTDAEGISVHNTYDSDGNLTSVTDGKRNRTEFVYDGIKRLLTKTHPDKSVETTVYNTVNPLSRTNEKGQIMTFTHDERHRIKTESFPSRNIRTYQYNAVGKILAVTETLQPTRANVAYTYDGLDRVLSETSHGVTHQFGYDLAGNRIRTTVGHSGRVIETEYDALGKITTLTEEGRSTHYQYDLAGNKVETSFSNGQKVVSTFDALNRVKTQTATASGAPLQSFIYTHDPVGNVTLMEETYAMAGVGSRTVSLEYDRIHRLTTEMIVPVGSGPLQSTNYTYDAAHNRIRKLVSGDKPSTTVSTYNSLNQLIRFTDETTGGLSATFDYDLNGNRIRRTASDGQVTTYAYDAQNRLIDVTEVAKERKIDILGPNGLKAEATYTVDGDYHYDYDYRTRRIAQSEDGIKTDLVFLGGTSILEFAGPGNDQAPLRAAGTAPTVEYIRGSDLGGGIGGILYSLREGQPSFTWYNHRGDVVAKTNPAGVLTYQAAYEAFGTRTAEQGETLDRQRANTREESAWGGLYENQRWRDLETGTYLTRDPAGFVDGPNLYAYVRQNPWSAFDPEGLEIPKSTPIVVQQGTRMATTLASTNPVGAVVVATGTTGLAGSAAIFTAAALHHQADVLRQEYRSSLRKPAAYKQGPSTSTGGEPKPEPKEDNKKGGGNPPPPGPDEGQSSISFQFSSSHMGTTVTQNGVSQHSHLTIDPMATTTNGAPTEISGGLAGPYSFSQDDFHPNETFTKSVPNATKSFAKQTGQIVAGTTGDYEFGKNDCITNGCGIANQSLRGPDKVSPQHTPGMTNKQAISTFKNQLTEKGWTKTDTQ